MVRVAPQILDRSSARPARRASTSSASSWATCLDIGYLARRAPRWLQPRAREHAAAVRQARPRRLSAARRRRHHQPVERAAEPGARRRRAGAARRQRRDHQAVRAHAAGGAARRRGDEPRPAGRRAAGGDRRGRDRRGARRSRRHDLRHRLARDREAGDGARVAAPDAGAARARRQGSDDRLPRRRPRPRRRRRGVGRLHDDRAGVHVGRARLRRGAGRRGVHRQAVERMRALRTGANGPAAEIDFGPFTSPRQLEIVERHVADAVARAPACSPAAARVGDGPARASRPPCSRASTTRWRSCARRRSARSCR